VPGIYPGRTRHFHIKVQAANQPVLTTQLYFPEESATNQNDFLFNPALLMSVDDGNNIKRATFNFVLKTV
ncbi:MAG: dioxygenase, partial [Cyanobacteria bacterium J06628_4]